MTVKGLIAEGARTLATAEIPDPQGDARHLLAFVLGWSRARLTANTETEISENMAERFRELIARRARHQPVAQIVGMRDFMGLEFEVTPMTLDPRPETETLVEAALHIGPVKNFLDLGTGTCCIAISLLAHWPKARAIATDRSADALSVAARNAARHGVVDRVMFVESDWFDGIEGRFPLIVCNPPYIALDEFERLAPDVRDWEPRVALTDNGDGLNAYRAIIAGAPGHLTPGGRIVLEIGFAQAESVKSLLQGAGFHAIEVVKDLGNRDRVVIARVN